MKRKSEEELLEEQEAGGTSADADDFLDFESGTFDHIPHYAKADALAALIHVREMERRHVFRSGLYYAVLSDLCRATEASLILGNDISKKRIETFILTCVEALGHISTTNYHLFLREIGDAVLLLFSSFKDVYNWWQMMNSWLNTRDKMWMTELDLSITERKQFKLECKTIVHAGEIDYSGGNVPISAAVNQIFKVEKLFRPHELGITQSALTCAKPALRSWKLRPLLRGKVKLPGDSEPMCMYVIDNYHKIMQARQHFVKERTKKVLHQDKSSMRSKPRR